MKKVITTILIFIVLVVLVIALIILFRGEEAGNSILKLIYKKPHEDIVKMESQLYNVDENLIYAIMKAESGFDEKAKSSAGAKGLMQVTDETFDWINSKYDPYSENSDIYNPRDNIHAGSGLLHTLFAEFDDLDAVLAAYNAGIGNVWEWMKESKYSSDGAHLENIPFGETRHYVKRVKDNYKMYQKLYAADETAEVS